MALLVKRLNQRGQAALEIAKGRGPKQFYGQVARAKLICGVRPDSEVNVEWMLLIT